MFTDRSHLLRHNPVQLNYGVAVTDIDNDGAFEIVVAGFGFPNLIYKWNGTSFDEIAPYVLADARRQSIGLAAGDVDGDGMEELYILNTDTFAGVKRFADRLFDFADGEWIDLFALPMNQRVLNLTAGRSVAVVDRAGVGRYGFFVANYGGPMRLYELDDDGYLRDVAPEAGLNKVTGGRSAIALPLLSPLMDIFVGNENGSNFLFTNHGDGTFSEVAEEAGLADALENARGVAALDADGNGRFDLAVGNWEGAHRLFRQANDGSFDDIAPPHMAAPSRVRTVIAADFDNDGYEELFFNNIGEANRLFALRGGDWQPINPGDALEERGLGTGAAVGDFNNDGRLELLITHGETAPQPLSLYAPPVNTNHYLRVLPLTDAGAPARGAQVTLTTPTRTQHRVIDAGSGYLCQMEPVAHFGLGQETSVTSVTVRWVDGRTVTLDAPAIDGLLRVPCPAT